MKNFRKKLRAFTLAEMAVVFMILGLIATATFKITKSNSTYYLNKFMYYAAFNNLQKGVAELTAAGISFSNPPNNCETGIKIENLCVDASDTAYGSSGFYNPGSGNQPNYWQGAVNVCQPEKRLPTRDELTTLHNYISSLNMAVSSWYWASTQCGTPYTSISRWFNVSDINDSGELCRGWQGLQVPPGREKARCIKDYVENTTGVLCNELSNLLNTVGTVDCSKTITGAPGTFTSANANFTTTNGMRFFNFGSTPAGTSDPLVKLFTVYIDIDGPKRNSVLNEDVMKFNLYTNGVVLPDYDSIGANDPNYLSASVKYWETATNKYEELLTSVSYREAYCKAKLVPSITTTYCNVSPPSYPTKTYAADPKCPNNNYECKVTINQPGFAFGN